MFSCKFCQIFKNTFFYRTPPVDASNINKDSIVLILTSHNCFKSCVKARPEKSFLEKGASFSELLVVIFVKLMFEDVTELRNMHTVLQVNHYQIRA